MLPWEVNPAMPNSLANKFALVPGRENAFYIWLSQPILIAVCLTVVNGTSRTCRVLLYIDVGLSLLQIGSVLLLYAVADRIG
jgi:hypothetical protein